MADGGWLTPLLGDKSFGTLGKELIARDAGLRERYGNPRSLEGRLHKLDGGKDWGLLDLEGFPRLLAKTLDVDLVKLEQRAREVQAGTAHHLYRIDDLGIILDLKAEGPFPGVPGSVLDANCWDRLWWLAPSGAGKDLVAHWFSVRRQVATRRAPSWYGVDFAGDDRPAFVAIDDPNGYHRPLRTGLCVAAPFLPPESDGRDYWTVVTSPPLREWLDPLLGWVEGRLPGDGGFDRAAVRRFVETHESAFETPGHVLGLCGVVDQQGPGLLRMGFSRLALECVRLAAGRAPAGDRVRRTLQKRGGEVVECLCRGLLLESDRDPALGIDPETFDGLLPEDLRGAPNVAGARELLHSKTVDGATVERVRGMLGRGTVDALIDMRVLEPHGLGFRLRPWLYRLGQAHVADLVVSKETETEDLGRALLRPHAAPEVLSRLCSVFGTGDTRHLQGALNRLRQDDPARVAALEGCFRAAGIAVLEGAKLPKALLERVWKQQFELAVRRYSNYPPLPLLDCASNDPWLDPGTWFLACLAIAERIGASEPVEFAAWPRSGPLPDGLTQVLNQASWSSWEHPLRPTWWKGAFDLCRRLFENSGTPTGRLPALMVPGAVACAVRDGRRPPGDIDIRWVLHQTRKGWLEPFEDQAQKAGVTTAQVVGALWQSWAAAQDTSNLRFDSLSEEDLRAIWQHAPAELFGKAPLFEIVLRSKGIPRDMMTPDQWRAFLASWDIEAHAPSDEPSAAIWREMPKETLLEWIRGGQLADRRAFDIRAIAWERAPQELISLAIAGVGKGNLGLAGQAPEEHRPALLPAVVARASGELGADELGADELVALRAWLHDYVHHRMSAWPKAFEALRRLPTDSSSPTTTARRRSAK